MGWHSDVVSGEFLGSYCRLSSELTPSVLLDSVVTIVDVNGTAIISEMTDKEKLPTEEMDNTLDTPVLRACFDDRLVSSHT